jgi:hypothetical protein
MFGYRVLSMSFGPVLCPSIPEARRAVSRSQPFPARPAVTVDALYVGAPKGVDPFYQPNVIDTMPRSPSPSLCRRTPITAAEILTDPKRRNGIETNPCRRYSLPAALFEPPILISVNL